MPQVLSGAHNDVNTKKGRRVQLTTTLYSFMSLPCFTDCCLSPSTQHPTGGLTINLLSLDNSTQVCMKWEDGVLGGHRTRLFASEQGVYMYAQSTNIYITVFSNITPCTATFLYSHQITPTGVLATPHICTTAPTLS